MAPHIEEITLAAAIRRYFDVVLYLLIFTGFGTLASTGKLDLATVLIVTSALLYRGYILARRRQVGEVDGEEPAGEARGVEVGVDVDAGDLAVDRHRPGAAREERGVVPHERPSALRREPAAQPGEQSVFAALHAGRPG